MIKKHWVYLLLVAALAFALSACAADPVKQPGADSKTPVSADTDNAVMTVTMTSETGVVSRSSTDETHWKAVWDALERTPKTPKAEQGQTENGWELYVRLPKDGKTSSVTLLGHTLTVDDVQYILEDSDKAAFRAAVQTVFDQMLAE